jgi:uncharacterized membrane protein
MIEGNLNTTNILLAIMAAVSVLQALVVVCVGVLAFRLYRETFRAIRDIEQRQIAPLAANVAALMASVDGILADVKDVTARVTRRTERLDAAVQDTMHSVDETVGRVLGSVESRLIRIARLTYGVTSAIQSLFKGRRSGETPGHVS